MYHDRLIELHVAGIDDQTTNNDGRLDANAIPCPARITMLSVYSPNLDEVGGYIAHIFDQPVQLAILARVDTNWRTFPTPITAKIVGRTALVCYPI